MAHGAPSKRRVVITGLGVVTSLSCQVDDLFARLCRGESGIHELKLIDTTDYKVKIAGDIYNWDPIAHISAKEMNRVDRFTQFAVVAAAEALAESKLDFAKEDAYRCGVILGSGVGGLTEIEEQMFRLFSKGPSRVSAMTVPKMMLNAAGGTIAIRYGLRGPNYAVATACASAGNAMGDALRSIQSGESDVLVTGGAEAGITRMGVSAFQNMKALSERNDAPQKASRPFDRDRDGFVLSEGAGVLVFEELEHARRRGAKIYAEVLGFGASCDAGHITQPDEQGTGAARAMSNALSDSGVPAEQVDYINAHGTSTPLGDKAETVAVKRVFGASARRLSISSTKSQLGHSLGASGGIELIVAIKTIETGIVPPTINLENPDPDCDLDYTPNQPKERAVKIAMSNSFGFGGHNASLIVARLA